MEKEIQGEDEKETKNKERKERRNDWNSRRIEGKGRR
jgi:hypothetical protein